MTSTPERMDKALYQALVNAYSARALLFHRGVAASKSDLLIAEIDAIPSKELAWNLKELGISRTAFRRVETSSGKPHQVFAHPGVIGGRPYLIAYYRNLATISRKGISQILFPTDSYENGRRRSMPRQRSLTLCRTLNRIVSEVIDATSSYDVKLSRDALVAEIGAQLQGSWANAIGKGASKAVEKVIAEYVIGNSLGAGIAPGRYQLDNGWTIVFSPEPDVAFYDKKDTKQIAIEIKGSLDKAGAQTRYGETKKSFAKQLKENPRCHTVYLASCFTQAVIDQIKADGQVSAWFNLTSILFDEDERKKFIDHVFYIVNRPNG